MIKKDKKTKEDFKEMINSELKYDNKTDLRGEYLDILYDDLTRNEYLIKKIVETWEDDYEKETRDYIKPWKMEEIKTAKRHLEEIKEILTLIEPKLKDLKKEGVELLYYNMIRIEIE